MMENEFEEESLSGVKASRTGLTLTHVMYVDYIVFFFFTKVNRREATTFNDCLEKYCIWSG